MTSDQKTRDDERPRRRIYVIAYNGGVEGWSGPIQAFVERENATAAVALLGGSFRVFDVPVWPEPACEWFNVNPLEVA